MFLINKIFYRKPTNDVKKEKTGLTNLNNSGDNYGKSITLPNINSHKSSIIDEPEFLTQAVNKINNYEYKKNIFKKMTDEMCHIKYNTIK